MYPSPVEFLCTESGAGGILVRWQLPEEVNVADYVVYQSNQAILPEQTEPFYSGVLPVQQTRIPPENTQMVAAGAATALWFLVLAQDTDGNLYRVNFSVAPTGKLEIESSIYNNPPDLIYRAEDKDAMAALERTSRALSRRFDADTSD
jgi:hypothetical protein